MKKNELNYIITTQYLQDLQIYLASKLKHENIRLRVQSYIQNIQTTLDLIDKFKEEIEGEDN